MERDVQERVDELLSAEDPGGAIDLLFDDVRHGSTRWREAVSYLDFVVDRWGPTLAPLFGHAATVATVLDSHASEGHEVPTHLWSLWSQPKSLAALVGAAAFPLAPISGGVGRVRVLRVGHRLSPAPDSCDAEFAEAVEAARDVVGQLDRRLRGALHGVGFEIWPRLAVPPAEGGSVAMAALVAFASFALGAPVPWDRCFSGTNAGHLTLPHDLAKLESKRRAVERFRQFDPLVAPVSVGGRPPSPSRPSDLLHHVFGAQWAPASAGTRSDDAADALASCLLAILEAARLPLASIEIERVLDATDWPALMKPAAGDLHVREALEAIPIVVQGSDGLFQLGETRDLGLGLRVERAHGGLASYYARKAPRTTDDDVEAVHHLMRSGDRPGALQNAGAIVRRLAHDDDAVAVLERLLRSVGPDDDAFATELDAWAMTNAPRQARTALGLARVLRALGPSPAPLARFAPALRDLRDPRDQFLSAHALLETIASLLFSLTVATTTPRASSPAASRRSRADARLDRIAVRPSLGLLVDHLVELDATKVVHAAGLDAGPLHALCARIRDPLTRASTTANERLHRRDALSRLATERGREEAETALATMVPALLDVLPAVAAFFANRPIVGADITGLGVAGTVTHLVGLAAPLEHDGGCALAFYRGVFDGRARFWDLASTLEAEAEVGGLAPSRATLRSPELAEVARRARTRTRTVAPVEPLRAELARLPQPIARALARAREPLPTWRRLGSVDAAFACHLRLVWSALCAQLDPVAAASHDASPAKVMPPIHRSVLAAIDALGVELGASSALARSLADATTATRSIARALVDRVERMTHVPGPLGAAQPLVDDALWALETLAARFYGAEPGATAPPAFTLVGRTATGALVDLTGFRVGDLGPSHAAPALVTLAPGEVALVGVHAAAVLAPYVRLPGDRAAPAEPLFAELSRGKGQSLPVEWLAVDRDGLLLSRDEPGAETVAVGPPAG